MATHFTSVIVNDYDCFENGSRVYTILVTSNTGSSWESRHRYTDFERLYSMLTSIYRVEVLPPMPCKSTFRMALSTGFREQRRQQLETFLRGALAIDSTLCGRPLQPLRDFLRIPALEVSSGPPSSAPPPSAPPSAPPSGGQRHGPPPPQPVSSGPPSSAPPPGSRRAQRMASADWDDLSRGFRADLEKQQHSLNAKKIREKRHEKNPDVCLECGYCPQEDNGQAHNWNCSRNPDFCGKCGYNPHCHGAAHALNCRRNPDACSECGHNPHFHGAAHALNCRRNPDFCSECGHNPLSHGLAHALNCRRNPDVCSECGCNPHFHGHAHELTCRRNPDFCSECGNNPQSGGPAHKLDCRRNPDFCSECGYNPRCIFTCGVAHALDCRRNPDFCGECRHNPHTHGAAHAPLCRRNPDVCSECGRNHQRGGHAPTCRRNLDSGDPDVCSECGYNPHCHGAAHGPTCRRNPDFCSECGCFWGGHLRRCSRWEASQCPWEVPGRPGSAAAAGTAGGQRGHQRQRAEGSPAAAAPRGRPSAAAASSARGAVPRAATPESAAEAEIRGIRLKLASAGSAKDLKRALRELQLRWHPDKNQGSEEVATKVFCFIQQEWERTLLPEPPQEVLLTGTTWL